MDTYMIFLRLLHITAGIFWVGSDLLMVFFIEPTVRTLGPGGGVFMEGLSKYSRYSLAMPVSSLITIVSGLLLYNRVSDGFSEAWMHSTPGLILTLGAIAGTLGFLEGMTLVGPTMLRIEKLDQTISEQHYPPTEAQSAEMRHLQSRGQYAMYLMTFLTLAAVIGMASARYM